MNRASLFLALVGSCLAACVTSFVPPPYEVVVTENTGEQRIDLLLRNTSRQPLCLHPGDWPIAAGSMELDGDGLIIVQNGQNLPQTRDLHETCFYCQSRIEAGQDAKGFLRSSGLDGIDWTLPAAQRQILVKINPVPCDWWPDYKTYDASQNITYTSRKFRDERNLWWRLLRR